MSALERLHIATFTPSSASASAHARPSPLLAPPTIATLPFNIRSIVSPHPTLSPRCGAREICVDAFVGACSLHLHAGCLHDFAPALSLSTYLPAQPFRGHRLRV